jgi:hypothetical protein
MKEAILQLVGAVQHGVIEEGEGDPGKEEGQGEGQGGDATGDGGAEEEEEEDTRDHSGAPVSSGSGGAAPPASQDAPVDLQNNVGFVPFYPHTPMLKTSVFH